MTVRSVPLPVECPPFPGVWRLSACVRVCAMARAGVGVNTLWPATAVATAAVEMLGGSTSLSSCRKPEIMADAAIAILTSPARLCSGNFFVDEDVLAAMGVTDLSPYSVDPSVPQSALLPDFFLPADRT